MKIALLHPPFGEPSGGNVYNRNILQQADLRRFPLHSFVVSVLDRDWLDEWSDAYDLLIWDSAFWQDMSALSEHMKRSRSALLCHYLPSLNPLATANERGQWRRFEDLVIASMRYVIATGQVVFDEIRKRFPDKAAGLCEPGIDEVFKPGSPPEKAVGSAVRLLTVANLLPEKGYLEILRALAGMTELPWRWYFCGSDTADAEFTARFWRTVDECHLRERMCYEGMLTSTQVSGLMRRSDIFVAASHYESYGIALAEAATMRLPIVCSETGSARQMVRHGADGFLFAAGDFDALRAQLTRLVGDAELRCRFRERQRFHGLSPQQCFAVFERLCHEAVSR